MKTKHAVLVVLASSWLMAPTCFQTCFPYLVPIEEWGCDGDVNCPEPYWCSQETGLCTKEGKRPRLDAGVDDDAGVDGGLGDVGRQDIIADDDIEQRDAKHADASEPDGVIVDISEAQDALVADTGLLDLIADMVADVVCAETEEEVCRRLGTVCGIVSVVSCDVMTSADCGPCDGPITDSTPPDTWVPPDTWLPDAARPDTVPLSDTWAPDTNCQKAADGACEGFCLDQIYDGDYTVDEDDTHIDVAALKAVKCITGELDITQTPLTSTADLKMIERVGGNLRIAGNSALTSLSGLDSLTGVGGLLSIQFNALTSLSGLEGVVSIDVGLSITSNWALESLSGVENITGIGYLYIAWNDALISLNGLGGVTSIGGYLYVADNAVLENLMGLDGATSIGGNMSIYNNNALTNLSGLENITSIEGDMHIHENDTLRACEVEGFAARFGRTCSTDFETNCHCSANNGAGTCD